MLFGIGGGRAQAPEDDQILTLVVTSEGFAAIRATQIYPTAVEDYDRRKNNFIPSIGTSPVAHRGGEVVNSLRRVAAIASGN